MRSISVKKDDFILTVLSKTKKNIDLRDQKYIPSTRLNKLIILIYLELEKENIEVDDFFWGYYRHGFFSRPVNEYLKQEFNSNFTLFDLPYIDSSLSGKVLDIIDNSISDLKNYFVRDREKFVNWIYHDKVPSEYKNFYLNHVELDNWFKVMKDDLNSQNNQLTLYNEKTRGIYELISNYYFSLNFVNDAEILEIFRKFTNLLEYSCLKLDNGVNQSIIKIKLDELYFLYDKRILTILTPYIETLKGDCSLVEQEKIEHLNTINSYKEYLNSRLDQILDVFDEENLLPTFSEMDAKIKSLSKNLPADLKSLDEIYEYVDRD
jgi:hypothetical protein